MNKKKDFYTGYEGEPKLIIIQKNHTGIFKTIINLWIGFFDEIMNFVQPNSNGQWQGITLYYHTEENWCSQSPWKYEDKILFIQQLELIEISQLCIESQTLLMSILDIFRDSISENDEIYFEYD